MKNKKASGAVGGGIIIVAVLLLLGGIFLDDSPSTYTSKSDYNNKNGESYPQENYLFYLNNTDLGKQQRVTQSFPNIELGSKIEYTTLLVEPYVELRSNMFTQSEVIFTLTPPKNKEVKEYLIYASPEVLSGSALLEIYVNETLLSRQKVSSSSFPIPIRDFRENKPTELKIVLEQPFFLNIFSWNKVELQDFKLVEVAKATQNQQRYFSFHVNRDFLDKAFVELTISCEEKQEVSPAIQVEVNGYIVSNENPQCLSNYNTISAPVPLNILNSNNNSLSLTTTGYYKLAYSIDTVYFNDQDTYKFSINSFNDIIDVVMYGDFDKEVIDLRINTQVMTLRRDEIKSIIPYLRFGTNTLEFLTKPIEFEEFIIEKNEFYGFE